MFLTVITPPFDQLQLCHPAAKKAIAKQEQQEPEKP